MDIQKDDLKRKLNMIKWLTRISALLFFASFPIAFYLSNHTDHLFEIIFSWFIFVSFFAVWVKSFKCPRCFKPFFGTLFNYKQFTKECVHCGLSLKILTGKRK